MSSNENFARIAARLEADRDARLARAEQRRLARIGEHEARELERITKLRKNRVHPRRAGDG